MLQNRNLHRMVATALLVLAFAAPAALAAPGDLDSADVAEMTMPAVVNINTDKVVERQSHPFMDDPFFRRFFDQQQEEGGNNERLERSLGSGVVISRDGYIVTNNHVVEGAENIRIAFNDRETYDAEIIGTDPATDVALIKIDPERDLPYLQFGDSDALRVGERVMAVGNPFGVGQTVTMGIVSAKGRSIGLMNYEDHIQSDAAINPGNSGGAMVNMRGELVGINSAILSRSGGSQGIGFAIPANMVERILESLREHGEVKRAWLGVQVRAVDQNVADYYGLDKPTGVLVDQVNDDTPAQHAGLEEGDIILSVDGKRVDTVAQLRNTVSLLPIGHKAELEIQRDGKGIDKTVKLGELPSQDELASTRPENPSADDGIEGVTVRPLNGQLRAHGQIPDNIAGVMVVEVSQRSNAAREGLASGDVIEEINDIPVTSLDGYRKAVKQHQDRPLKLRVYRARGDASVSLFIPR